MQGGIAVHHDRAVEHVVANAPANIVVDVEARAIGQAAAMEVILTGEPIPAERAYNLGLVTRLAEPGKALDEALTLAAKICEAAPLAVWASRKVVLAAASADDDTLKRMTNEEFAGIMASEDTKEGL